MNATTEARRNQAETGRMQVTFEAPYAGSIGKFLGLENALRAAVAFLEEN